MEKRDVAARLGELLLPGLISKSIDILQNDSDYDRPEAEKERGEAIRLLEQFQLQPGSMAIERAVERALIRLSHRYTCTRSEYLGHEVFIMTTCICLRDRTKD